MEWNQYTNESTETLVELIRRKDQQEQIQVAEVAFECFCYRFQVDLITKCRNLCSKLGINYEVADEVAFKTFERFWKYPRFDKEKCKTGNIDTCCKFYLYRIASRILADTVSKRNDDYPYKGDEELQLEFPDWSNSEIDELTKKELISRSKQIEAILNKLGPKHKTIYLTYKLYETAGRKLPRQLLLKLRKNLNLKQSTIRFYKNEAFEAVETFLKSHVKK